MKQILLLPAILIQLAALAQDAESIKKDSLYIDSLQKVFPFKKDTARVNCLNIIAEGFLNRNGWNIRMQSDSAYFYATIANKEARKLNYKRGIALSLGHLNHVSFFEAIDNNNKRTENSGTFKKWEQYQNQLFAIARELNDNHIWGIAYYWQANFRGKKGDKIGDKKALKNSLEYFKKAGDELRESEISTWLCMQFSENGEYEAGFGYCKRSLELARKFVADPNVKGFPEYMMQQALMNMSDLYAAAGDYETAINYLRQTEQFHKSRNSSMTWSVEAQMSDLFAKMGRHDSAEHYYKPINANNPRNWTALRLGEILLAKGNYDSALIMFKTAIDDFRKIKNANTKGIKNSLTGAAKACMEKKHYKAGLPLAKESLAIAEKEGDRISIRDNLEVLSELFFRTGKSVTAYLYHKRYARLKDSLLTHQLLWRLNNYKKDAEEDKRTSQISLLKKDNQLSQAKLKQETTLKNSLVVGLILLILSGIFIFRTLHLKRKNEKLRRVQLENELKVKELESSKKQSELQQKATELEMQALRAQMNPHFIFNCLSSINRFVLKNETEAASDYLTRFSRLIRMVLINSQKSMIPLEDEMEMLRLYLDMERLRFKNSFDYNITYTNTIETGSIMLPPLLLQPFCENAIWHGLMHKEGQGRLDIAINMENNIFQCTIADNGIGRKKASEIKTKSGEGKSLGLKITTDRLALLNHHNNIKTEYTMHDLTDKNGNAVGTKVAIRINYIDVKELV